MENEELKKALTEGKLKEMKDSILLWEEGLIPSREALDKICVTAVDTVMVLNGANIIAFKSQK